MKTTLILTALLLAAGTLSAQHKLTVTVSGMNNLKGQLLVAVYDEAGFLKKYTYGKMAGVDAETMQVVIDSVASGVYAISAFQDENGNNRLDTGAFGIPTEPCAFSNNAKGYYGPPKFDDCAFKVEGDTEVEIMLE